MKNIVIHIPHDGNDFPTKLMQNVIIPKSEFESYHKEISDRHISKLAENLDCIILKFPISRMLCDVERFLENEIMEDYGMGFCYKKAIDGKTFKIINSNVKQRTKKYYLKHHNHFDKIAKSFENKYWTIIDLHSFHKNIIVRNLTKQALPDICIGYEKDFCDENFVTFTQQFFENNCYITAINYPYEGSFIPNIVYANKIKTKLNSIMIEINKTCYLDDNFEIEPIKFNKLKCVFENYVKTVKDEFNQHHSP